MSPAPSGESHSTNLAGEGNIPYSDIRRALRDRQTARTRNSCLPCRERKVRCNREHPCSICIKRDHPDLCIYAAPSLPAAHGHAARRAATLHATLREAGPPSSKSASPSPGFRPTPRVDDSSQPTIPSPPSSSLMGGGSLLAIAREHSPQPRDDDASRRDVLENAMRPLLGMASMDEAGLESGHHGASRNDDPYADLPGDQELLNLFSVYRIRVHPFQLIIDDLDAVEGELCAIINQRAGSSFAEKSQPRQQVSTDRRRFLSLLHAILATGALFSEIPDNERSVISQRHVRCAFDMLRACNYLLVPFVGGVRTLLILGLVLQNSGNPQAAWILAGSTIRMAIALGIVATSSTARPESSPVAAETARHLRLAIICQDALLSLAFNRQPASHELDSVHDLPILNPPTPNRDAGLNYGQAMNWLCHFTLRHWVYSSFQPGSLTIERFTNFFDDMDTLESALQDHLRGQEACHSIQAIQEFYSLELHRNFTTSTFCRPILTKNGHQSLSYAQVELILERLQRALKRSVRAFIRLRSVSSHATRSWAFVHNGLTSALLLSFMKETRNEDDSRQIQDELIKSLSEGGDILASESASGATFASQMTNAHRKSLKALKSLKRISEEERHQRDRYDNVDQRNSIGSFNPVFTQDTIDAIQDPGSSDFDELLRSFDYSSALPMEAFDYITSDPIVPGRSFEPFNSL
ncbi:hypothetical protein VM1G_02148 [Cytospora mali]|uniref:Zn(2)-C6 fungal-type domain-containing protein n=1 Tax=Cytospora mali TaxID=578113 RepID=A0A194VPR1_CYTMA|nr:hypothetical protein VM1G_02148 [Valsa mali]